MKGRSLDVPTASTYVTLARETLSTSVTVLSFALFTASMVLNWSSGDHWWLLASGQRILEKFDGVGIGVCLLEMSWVVERLPWVNHEWLSCVTIAALTDMFGLDVSNVLWLLFSGSLGALILFMVHLDPLGNRCERSELFAILCLGGTMVVMPMRVMLLDHWLLLVELVVIRKSLCGLLDGDPRLGKPQSLLLIPVLELLWVNAHMGSHVLLFVPLLVRFLVNVWGRLSLRVEQLNCRWFLWASLSLVLSLVASLVNPFGVEAWKYPIENMMDPLMKDMVMEFQPPDMHSLHSILFVLLPALLLVLSLGPLAHKSMRLSGMQRVELLHDILFIVAMGFLWVGSLRFGTMLSMSLLMLGYKWTVSLKSLLPNSMQQLVIGKRGKRAHLLTSILCLMTLIPFLFLLPSLDQEQIDHFVVSDTMVDELKQSGRLYNHYDVGGYLVYKGVKVLQCQAYHPYKEEPGTEQLMEVLMPTDDMEGLQYKLQVIEQWDFDTILTSPYDVMMQLHLQNHPEYIMVLEEVEKDGSVWQLWKRGVE